MKKIVILGLLALATSISFAEEAVKAMTTRVISRVEYAAPGSKDFKPLSKGQILAPGSTIRTSSDGVAFVALVPGTIIRVGHGSTVVLSEMGITVVDKKVAQRKATLDLREGTLSALIDKSNPQGTDFRIRTGNAVAAARGTFYGVKASKDKTYVLVKDGKVGVRRNNTL